MNKRLLLLIVCAFLLVGCSPTTSESQSEYDELELMTYSLCLEKHLEGNSYNYGNAAYMYLPELIEKSQEACAELKPKKN